MDHKTETNLDGEFRRFLQILRPYLCQLLDQDVIDICNAWIRKLSACEEKVLRNKYIFALCYQIAKGVLDEPFVKLPPSNELPPLQDDESVDGSCNEVECLVIDSESAHTKFLFHNRSPSQIYSNSSRFDESKNKETSCSRCDLSTAARCEENLYKINCELSEPPCSSQQNNLTKTNDCGENYYCKANNLIMKLREIRKQNIYLKNELVLLREETKNKRIVDDSLEDSVLKIDNATITYSSNHNSNTTLTSLKCKLQEIQSSRNDLIETVSCLQDKLDHFDEMKKHEIEEIVAQHKLEIIKLKTSIREEVKESYEGKLNELKKEYENNMIQIQNNAKEEIENLTQIKDKIIAEKGEALKIKEEDILQLKRQLEDIKSHQVSVLNKFIDYSTENSTGSIKYRSHELEKRLNKVEKNKNKLVKAYEAKIATLQREKHLLECSLKLQLIKQRTQIVNEVTDENQVVLAAALEKLENKYKEIVASMQATAVQRRIQDQMALESLVQAVCGIATENPYVTPTNPNTGQCSGKVRNQNKEQSPDREIGTLRNSNRIDNAVNKSFGDDSVITGYCLNSEKLQELFQRVHIPQRDVGDLPK